MSLSRLSNSIDNLEKRKSERTLVHCIVSNLVKKKLIIVEKFIPRTQQCALLNKTLTFLLNDEIKGGSLRFSI